MADEQPDVDAPFGVEISDDGGSATIVVSGELDIATVEQLERSLQRVGPGGRLIMDVRGLTSIDSSGIRVLMSLDIRSRLDGWRFAIVSRPGAVQKVLDPCRVSERVLMVDDPADAG
jgi:anti-sigma B factor antagonist